MKGRQALGAELLDQRNFRSALAEVSGLWGNKAGVGESCRGEVGGGETRWSYKTRDLPPCLHHTGNKERVTAQLHSAMFSSSS